MFRYFPLLETEGFSLFLTLLASYESQLLRLFRNTGFAIGTRLKSHQITFWKMLSQFLQPTQPEMQQSTDSQFVQDWVEMLQVNVDNL